MILRVRVTVPNNCVTEIQYTLDSLSVEFLGLDDTKIKTGKINKANYKKILRKNWADEMEVIYKQHCEVGMKKRFL